MRKQRLDFSWPSLIVRWNLLRERYLPAFLRWQRVPLTGYVEADYKVVKTWLPKLLHCVFQMKTADDLKSMPEWSQTARAE